MELKLKLNQKQYNKFKERAELIGSTPNDVMFSSLDIFFNASDEEFQGYLEGFVAFEEKMNEILGITEDDDFVEDDEFEDDDFDDDEFDDDEFEDDDFDDDYDEEDIDDLVEYDADLDDLDDDEFDDDDFDDDAFDDDYIKQIK